MIVLASLAVATIFLHASIQDFTSSTVVTTIATTTASLSEVYFPSVILCSINQIRKSLFTVSQILTGRFLDLILEFGSQQNWRHQAPAADLLLWSVPQPDGGGERDHHSVRFQVRWEETGRASCFSFREKVVKKLMLHWHLISDTNSTDWWVSVDWETAVTEWSLSGPVMEWENDISVINRTKPH